MRTKLPRSVLWLIGSYLVAATFVVRAASSEVSTFRIELGASDDAFLLGGDRAWGRAYRDKGPFRVRRGERRMTYFAARMAYRGASLRIPAAANDAVTLRLRMHRYGEPGFVDVFGNGVRMARLEFREDSYPWDVREIAVSPSILRSEALRLEFQGESTGAEPRLPTGAIAAFDWVELASEAGAKQIRPAPHARVLAVVLPFVVLLMLLWARASIWLAATVTSFSLATAAAALWMSPAAATNGFEHVPIVFVSGLPVFVALRWLLRTPIAKARALTAAFVLVLLFHATIIFFPDHQPPDLGPHLGQIRFLNDARWNWDDFWEFSSSHGESGRGKPHFGSDYAAPYPPWTYFIVHGLRKLVDHPRFWIEFVGMFSASVLTLLTYGCAVKLSREEKAPAFAFALMSLEISTWHHASRVHTPGLVGEVFFVAAVTYLAWNLDLLSNRRHFAAFALLSMLATLAYTATLFHFVIFMVLFAAWEVVAAGKHLPSKSTIRAVAGSAIGTLGSFALFYHHFVKSALASRKAILVDESYRAPARFLLLRNQMRDTVRILTFGYPIFVLLALPAYFRLKQWGSGEMARRIVFAWTGTYISLLLLKDPALFPQLFLHVKEDLLFAPLICILGGMSLAAMWKRSRVGRVTAGLVLALLLVLQVRGYLYNANPIAVWAETERPRP